MTIYLVNIILTLIMSTVAEKIKFSNKLNKQKSISFFFIMIILAIWTFVYAFRGAKVGTDTSGYIGFYEILDKGTLSYLQYLDISGEPIFESIKYFCCKVLNFNWIGFAAISAIITYFPIIYTVKKEQKDLFCFSLLLYIFLMFYYSGFNAMRQAIAVGITFLSYCLFLKKKKYFKYTIGILLASGFHATALIVIPFHLISKLPLKSKILWSIIGMFMIMSFAFPSVWNYAISFLEMVGKDYADNTFTGSGYLRVLVCVVPIVLGLWKYKLLKKFDNEIDQQIILLIFAAFMLIFSTNNWLFARVSEYFYIYAILFIPKLQFVFNQDSRNVARYIILLMYFLYMVSLLLHGDANLYPYSFI